MNLEFNANEDYNKQLLINLKKQLKVVYLGGGLKRIENEHAKGKMTARERIDYLLDNSNSIEIGGLAGYEMYEDHGGCPSAGVIVKIKIMAVVLQQESLLKLAIYQKNYVLLLLMMLLLKLELGFLLQERKI